MKEKPTIKVLFFVEAMGGGIFTYIVDLANGLADHFDLYIAYSIRSQTPKDYETYFDKRIHLIEVKNFTRSINIKKDIKAFFEIKKIANEVKPDIIHLHSSKAGALGRLAFDGKKIPLFYTPHGYSFLMQNYGVVKRNVYRLIETIAAKSRCTTISCGKGEHAETLKLTKRAVCINNGINIKSLSDMLSTVEKREHDFTVFTLGRICYQKNPELFNNIASAMPDVHFLWIGDGELRNKLTAKNIEVTGWLDRHDALSKSMNADVFLLTSLWEGLPISLLEAMYMKKLCVVNDVIGNHDVISNNVNGFVCGKVSEFVNAINSESKGLIERAYDDIEQEYNTVKMAEQYQRIYLSAIPDRKK